MMSKLSDEWQTPQWLFKELDREFNFDIDLCATKENSKCAVYCSDYFSCNFIGDHGEFFNNTNGCIICYPLTTAFMNPPYSNPKPFIEKAWEDSKHCKIVCLVKCDPSTKWWATFWEYASYAECCTCGRMCWDVEGYDAFRGGGKKHTLCSTCGNILYKIEYNGPKPGCKVRFFPKRIKFDPPEGYEGKAGSPSFPSALVIMDRRGL